MTPELRRNACPSLSAPMQTGDGLLARLTTDFGIITPAALAGVARAAELHGSGLLEITRRGSLQIRGLTEASTTRLRAALSELDLPLASPIMQTGPLAGLDPDEISDPRPMAVAIASGIEKIGRPLAAKMSVVVDGGGSFPLSDLIADFRLSATPSGWLVSVGGSARAAKPLGLASDSQAIETVLRGLAVLAEKGSHARARDLMADELEDLRCGLNAGASSSFSTVSAHPIGSFPLKGDNVAVCIRLPFGQATSRQFVAIAEAALSAGATEFRLAPGYALLVICPSTEAAELLTHMAADIDLIVTADDPRLAVVACAGAPNCGSALISTKQLAGRIAALPTLATVHVSGCEKRCAEPVRPVDFTIVGSASGRASIQDRGGKTLTEVAEDAAFDAFRQVVAHPVSDKRRGERLATQRRNTEKRPGRFAGVGNRR